MKASDKDLNHTNRTIASFASSAVNERDHFNGNRSNNDR